MKFFLLDRENLFRDGLRSLLVSSDHDVACYQPDGAMVAQMVAYRPDVILLEPIFVGDETIDLLGAIKQAIPTAKVVIMTSDEEHLILPQAIQAGVDGYMTKHIESASFFELIAHLEAGEPAISPTIAPRLFTLLRNQSEADKKKKLSAPEIRVLEKVRRGASNQVIARELGVSQNTVKFHLKQINQKLGSMNRTEAVMLAIQEKIIPMHST